MKQLAEHISGMDARIGLPGEHLAKGLVEEVNHPIFATAVGLVIHALDNPIMEEYSETATYPSAGQEIKAQPQQSPVQMQSKPRPKFLDKVKTWVEGYSQSSSNYIE
jgi:cell division ATPase FtsA